MGYLEEWLLEYEMEESLCDEHQGLLSTYKEYE
jgi:hypothetical protein